MAFTKDDWVKEQFNKPKDSNGNFVAVLPPRGGYSQDDLLLQAYKRGWTDNFFSDSDNPNNFPYWDSYLMPEGGAKVFVSVFGEVACCYNPHSDDVPKFRVMAQQWELQHMPDDFSLTIKERREAEAKGIHPDTAILNKIRQRQKYLIVNINTNTCYKQTHGSQRLHNMVGLVHSPICYEDTEWDANAQMYRLKGSFALDHLDTDKSNNSVYNLNWTTDKRNQRMTGVDWPIEQKMQFFRDAEKLSRENRDKLLIKQ
ncbi:MAG TPA: hypothetical protein PLU47_17975 [Azonexus sp.]|nr:hypothetical protein [Azonexus sp.]